MKMKRFGTVMKAYKSSFFLRRVSKKARGSHLQTLLTKRRLKRAGVSKKAARRRASAEEMEMVNLKLYLENRSIMEENRTLREKALVLRQENQTLRSHLVGQSLAASLLLRS